MTNARTSFLVAGLVALASLQACSGKFARDDSGAAGASSTAGGTTSAAGASASAGSSESSMPPPCCNLIPSCGYGDETYSSTQCPVGATCYSRVGCCGTVNNCAHFNTSPPVDAGPPIDGGDCTILGDWWTHSAPWKGEATDATITFNSDGSLTGVPSFTGSWSLVGSTLTIQNTVGPDMTCPFADHWTLTFDSECQTAPLLPIDSGCTGARRYLDWNVTLSRPLLR